MTPETPDEELPADRLAKKRALQAAADAPCPKGGGHEDPDDSGQCIRCGTPWDIIEDVDY